MILKNLLVSLTVLILGFSTPLSLAKDKPQPAKTQKVQVGKSEKKRPTATKKLTVAKKDLSAKKTAKPGKSQHVKLKRKCQYRCILIPVSVAKKPAKVRAQFHAAKKTFKRIAKLKRPIRVATKKVTPIKTTTPAHVPVTTTAAHLPATTTPVKTSIPVKVTGATKAAVPAKATIPAKTGTATKVADSTKVTAPAKVVIPVKTGTTTKVTEPTKVTTPAKTTVAVKAAVPAKATTPTVKGFKKTPTTIMPKVGFPEAATAEPKNPDDTATDKSAEEGKQNGEEPVTE